MGGGRSGAAIRDRVASARGSEECFYIGLGLLGNKAGVFEYVQERLHAERIEQRAAAGGDVGERAIERPRGAVRPIGRSVGT